MNKLLSTTQAAKELGISPARVRALIAYGVFRAEKVGFAWLIRAEDVEAIRPRIRGKAGRPRKMAGGNER